jgi:ATP-binding protein involved in chromosome partitioning
MSKNPVREADVLAALRAVMDPDLQRDIVSLNFVRDVRIDGGSVAFTVNLTTPACPAKHKLKAQAEREVMRLPGVAEVDVTMTATVAGPAASSLPGKQPIPGAKNVIAVSSGKGGVGKSTVCVNIACALSQCGARVGILDGDVYGPNIPLMLGVTGRPQGTNDRIFPFVRNGIQVISMGLLVPEDQPMIWRGPMLNKAVQQFMFQVDWRDLDYLLVDLPPGTGDVQLTLTQNTQIRGAVIVTTPQEVALQDVRKAIRMFEKVGAPCLGIVENMSYFAPPGSNERYEIFGSGGGARLAEEFGIPLLGQIPIGIEVRAGGDSGRPVTLAEPDGAIARAFRDVANQLAARISTLNLAEAST